MRIRELFLKANDLPTLANFYGEMLGFPLKLSAERLVLILGETRLNFDRSTDPQTETPFYHFAFNIPADRIAQAIGWARSHVPLIADRFGNTLFEFEEWAARALYFYDPQGNIVELIARNNLTELLNQRDPDVPFGIDEIQCISEIGIVVEDVQDTVRRFQAVADLDEFSGAGSDEFTALGNDLGLFIVVRRGREWFPNTGKRATSYPTNALFFDDDGKSHDLHEDHGTFDLG